MAVIKIPRELATQIERLGYNVNDFVIEALQEKVNRHRRRRKRKDHESS